MPVSKTLIAAGAGVYLVGSAAAYSLFKTPSPQPQVQQHATFDSLADDYDAKVNFEETFMGLKLLRRWLVAQAQVPALATSYPAFQPCSLTAQSVSETQMTMLNMDLCTLHMPLRLQHAVNSFVRVLRQGDVLEISAGTGRNIPYYKWRSLQSVTMTDASRHMLFYAK